MHNVVSDSLTNDRDVRPQILTKALDELATKVGQENWSIFELATFALLILQMVYIHCKEYKYSCPKRMSLETPDGQREVSFSILPKKNKKLILPQ